MDEEIEAAWQEFMRANYLSPEHAAIAHTVFVKGYRAGYEQGNDDADGGG